MNTVFGKGLFTENIFLVFAEVKSVASALMSSWLGIIRDATGPSGKQFSKKCGSD